MFGVFGYLRESKRLFSVLDAFGSCAAPARPAGCWWPAISSRATSSALRRPCSPPPESCGIPYLPEAEFWTAAAAVDACINLRYPAAGETSGIAVRLMGIGKPVLLTDANENARFRRTPASASPADWPNGNRCGSTWFC